MSASSSINSAQGRRAGRLDGSYRPSATLPIWAEVRRQASRRRTHLALGFMALLAYFSLTIVERMHSQRMTVFDLPMSIVYGAVGLGCLMMLARQIQVVWRNARDG